MTSLVNILKAAGYVNNNQEITREIIIYVNGKLTTNLNTLVTDKDNVQIFLNSYQNVATVE